MEGETSDVRLPQISFNEQEETRMDDYVFCTDCGYYVYEFCSAHGPLQVIPDNDVPATSQSLFNIPRAALTIPAAFLHLASSRIPGAGIGVFSTLTLPSNVRFGPYLGKITDRIDSKYSWQLYRCYNQPSHVVDAGDEDCSNWMRYVNCSRHWNEQNLLAYQYKGQIYYRTTKVIPPFTELLVHYGIELKQCYSTEDLCEIETKGNFSNIWASAKRPDELERKENKFPTKKKKLGEVHLKSHNTKKVLSCPTCKYICTTKKDLKKHLRTHARD